MRDRPTSLSSPLPERLFRWGRESRRTSRGRPWQHAAALALALPALALAAPVTYRFDPVHSQVWFRAEHQGFSHPLGRVRIKDGWFQFDEKDWSASRVDVVLDMTTADMGDAKWNDTVRSSQLLDTGRWPSAHFVSRSVEKKDATHGVIHGDLSLHGVTRPVDVAFTLNLIATDPYAFKRKAGFSATATLPRSTFGIKRYADVIGEDIGLLLEIEGLRDSSAAPPRQQEP